MKKSHTDNVRNDFCNVTLFVNCSFPNFIRIKDPLVEWLEQFAAHTLFSSATKQTMVLFLPRLYFFELLAHHSIRMPAMIFLGRGAVTPRVGLQAVARERISNQILIIFADFSDFPHCSIDLYLVIHTTDQRFLCVSVYSCEKPKSRPARRS